MSEASDGVLSDYRRPAALALTLLAPAALVLWPSSAATPDIAVAGFVASLVPVATSRTRVAQSVWLAVAAVTAAPSFALAFGPSSDGAGDALGFVMVGSIALVQAVMWCVGILRMP